MRGVGGLWADLVDLVLPAECAGCRARPATRRGFCPGCVAVLEALRPRLTRPSPAPPGLPPCVALGPYGGPLRQALLAYKERGRHGLARPLGALLAEVVAAAVPVAAAREKSVGVGCEEAVGAASEKMVGVARVDAVGAAGGVLLVPVPDTAAAARARYGDHLARLARHAARRLRQAGWPVRVAQPLRALPRPDSVTLDSAARARAAEAAFQLRPGGRVARYRVGASRPAVVLLDDIVTTGVTLAAVSRVLTASGLPPTVAAVLAATERRHPM